MKSGAHVLIKLLMAAMLMVFGLPAHSQQAGSKPGLQEKDRAKKPNAAGQAAPTASADGTSYLPLAGGTMTGPLQLAGDPFSPTQAATKNYVDMGLTTALPLTGGSLSGSLATQNTVSKLPHVDVRHTDFAGGADPTGTRDSLPAIQAAINYALTMNTSNSSDYPSVYFAPGHYLINGTIVIPTRLHLSGDGKDGAELQEINPTSTLITVVPSSVGCAVAACYGGVDNLTLAGSGKLTKGTLLEIESGSFQLRDIHFYNNGGRGLQMNDSAERVVGYNLSFYYVRWPFIMAGDNNEDYFYNTHIFAAGQTNDVTTGAAYTGDYCYSINCTAGLFNSPGTQANPTVLYPEPHAAVYVEKAVNVGFLGGSIKASPMISGVRVWNASLVKFQNVYHEDTYGGGFPRANRAYILGGKAEQTFLTSSLTPGVMSAAVNDTSWMPQYFGRPSDATAPGGNAYTYVMLPQDYDRSSSAPSAYVAGLQQNQFELINVNGFASDGNMYVQTRNVGGTAPTGVTWPAGSVVEQYGAGFEGALELDNVHINQVQGPTTVGGYTEHCDQTNVYTCGEIVAGYAPDVINPSTNSALNQIGFYAPLGDPNDPVPSAVVNLRIHNVEMFNSSSNPYIGQIATHKYASIQVAGAINLSALESSSAVTTTTAGKQLSIAPATGGSSITAPMYASGAVAGVTVTLPDAGEVWDSGSNYFVKKAFTFGPYQQYGNYMIGEQFQNIYCLFDTPATAGGHVANRFCVGGGPGNATQNGGGPATGPGIEYNSWNGNTWSRVFRVSAINGVGAMVVNGSAMVSGTFTTPYPQYIMASGVAGGQPAITLGPGAGTGAALTGGGGENNMFFITFKTGTAPAAGNIFTAAFGTPINTSPLAYSPACEVTINTAASTVATGLPHTGFPVSTTTTVTVPASADLLQPNTVYRSVVHCEL